MRNRDNRIYIWIGLIVAMFLIRAMRSSSVNLADWLIDEILMLPGIVVGISFHEFGHAFVSYKLGDPTPKLQGRLTVNPAAHIDLIGLVCLIFAGFGWGVPVQIDPRYYKNKRRDQLLVSLAGVAMNLIIAVIMAIILRIMITVWPSYHLSAVEFAAVQIVDYAFMINIVLMVFNLLPVPPLDGFNVITQLFNLEKYSWYWEFYQRGWTILLLLIIFDVTDIVLTPIISVVQTGLLNLIVY